MSLAGKSTETRSGSVVAKGWEKEEEGLTDSGRLFWGR